MTMSEEVLVNALERVRSTTDDVLARELAVILRKTVEIVGAPTSAEDRIAALEALFHQLTKTL